VIGSLIGLILHISTWARSGIVDLLLLRIFIDDTRFFSSINRFEYAEIFSLKVRKIGFRGLSDTEEADFFFLLTPPPPVTPPLMYVFCY
jgi:hypothetical protein